MKLKFNITRIILTLMMSLSLGQYAIAGNSGLIELTKSTRSETLGDIYTFALYSPLAGDSKLGLYGGMQLMQLEKNDLGEESSAIKILLGQSFGKTFAPFYEIGTDLYGFLTLLDNDKDTDRCTEDQECSIDFFFRIGLRIKFGNNLHLGIYHENIDFGDFHENKSGEHRYIGSSLGFAF